MILFSKVVSLSEHFLYLSLLAVGGVSSTISELHHYLVDSTHWLNSTEFFKLYALAQIAPGPNVQFVALFGWQVAGWLGGVSSLLAMCGPSSVLAIVCEHIITSYHDTKWLSILKHGIVPISIGLLFTNGWVITQYADGGSIKLMLLTLLTVCVCTVTRISPIVLIICGAGAGILFL